MTLEQFLKAIERSKENLIGEETLKEILIKSEQEVNSGNNDGKYTKFINYLINDVFNNPAYKTKTRYSIVNNILDHYIELNSDSPDEYVKMKESLLISDLVRCSKLMATVFALLFNNKSLYNDIRNNYGAHYLANYIGYEKDNTSKAEEIKLNKESKNKSKKNKKNNQKLKDDKNKKEKEKSTYLNNSIKQCLSTLFNDKNNETNSNIYYNVYNNQKLKYELKKENDGGFIFVSNYEETLHNFIDEKAIEFTKKFGRSNSKKLIDRVETNLDTIYYEFKEFLTDFKEEFKTNIDDKYEIVTNENINEKTTPIKCVYFDNLFPEYGLNEFKAVMGSLFRIPTVLPKKRIELPNSKRNWGNIRENAMTFITNSINELKSNYPSNAINDSKIVNLIYNIRSSVNVISAMREQRHFYHWFTDHTNYVAEKEAIKNIDELLKQKNINLEYAHAVFTARDEIIDQDIAYCTSFDSLYKNIERNENERFQENLKEDVNNNLNDLSKNNVNEMSEEKVMELENLNINNIINAETK